jgi:uncharacterized membrane protein YbaN (DUF454 family)
MILNIIIAIVAVAASTGLFTWAMVWFARSSMSEDSTLRRRARFAEVLMSVAVGALYGATAQNAKERKIGALVVGFILAAWLFRGARLLLGKGKA